MDENKQKQIDTGGERYGPLYHLARSNHGIHDWKNWRWCYRKEKNDAKFRRRCLARNHAIISLGFLFLTYSTTTFPDTVDSWFKDSPSLLRICPAFGPDCGDDPFTDKSLGVWQNPFRPLSSKHPAISFRLSFAWSRFFFPLPPRRLYKVNNTDIPLVLRRPFKQSHKTGRVRKTGKTRRPRSTDFSRSDPPSEPKDSSSQARDNRAVL